MATRLPEATITLRKSGGGVFEVTVDGALRWSKRQSGAFPNDSELLAAIK